MSTASDADAGVTSTRLLADDDRAGLRDRWLRIQERFVDDPAGAVRDADGLVEDVIEQIRSSLDRQRGRTRGDVDLEDATTEQLRTTLHRYELLLDQLVDVPAPTDWHDEHRGGSGRTDTTDRSDDEGTS